MRRTRGEGQLSACDEVERLGFSPYVQHHGAERIAGERVCGDAERDLNVMGMHTNEMACVEAEFSQACCGQCAGLSIHEILPDP